jgi:hypothetical protein
VAQRDGHPEQASFAPRRIWASRAKFGSPAKPKIARLARFPIKTALRHEATRQTLPSSVPGKSCPVGERPHNRRSPLIGTIMKSL